MIDSVAEFIRLRCSENPEEYQRSAHELIASDVIEKLIEEHPDMIKWVIHNKLVSVEVLDRLSRHEDPEVREEVAGKRKCSLAIFSRLAVDENYLVRAKLVYNAKLPPEVLVKMLDDPEPFVLEKVKRKIEEHSATD